MRNVRSGITGGLWPHDGALGRRGFLQLSAVLALLAGCNATRGSTGGSRVLANGDALPVFDRVGDGKRVVMIGGGLSALCAAYELRNAGFEVVVLERGQRIGGRLFTMRGYFADDQWAEMGGTRIPSHHALTLGYARKFGIEIDKFPDDDARAVYMIDGQRWVHRAGEDIGPKLPGAWGISTKERENGLPWIKSDFVKQAFPELGDPNDPSWPNAAQLEFDKVTFVDYLRSKGASETAIKIIRATNGAEVDMYSALAWLGLEVLDKDWDATHRMRGGNDQLPGSLAKDLGNAVIKGARVVAVRQEEGGAVVTYRDKDGAQHEERGDWVVCAVAPPILAEIEWKPGLSEVKRRAAASVIMQPCTRINLQFSSRFWYDSDKLKGLNIAHTDAPIERLWDMAATQPGKHGILTVYTQADRAVAAAAIPASQREKWALGHIETFLPGATAACVKSNSWVWHEQDWVKGGWMALKPGQFDLYQGLRAPEGRITFCGDHTTLGSGWMQGALDSAHRVVEELVAQVKGKEMPRAG